MKKIIICLIIILQLQQLHAQNVGIGTTTPDNSAALDVSSTTKGMLIPRMTTALRTTIPNPATGLMVYDTNLSAFYFYNGSAWVPVSSGGSSDWITNGNNIYNSNTGFVGIGTSSPNTRLHVDGSLRVSTGNLSIDNSIGSLFFRTGNQNRGFFEMRGANYDVNIGTSGLNTTGDFTIQTNALDRIKVLPGGNVGIGFSSPTYKLDINGNTRTAGNLTVEDGYLRLLNTTDSKIWQMQYSNATGRLILTEQGVERFVFKNGGNVGIGVITPTEKLHVGGNATIEGNTTVEGNATFNTTNPTLQLQNNSVNKGFIQLSGDNIRIGTNSGNTAGKFVIRTNGADRVFVDGSGNVNIGSQTDAPGYIFRVGGKMICEEVKVKLEGNWPDYVFGESYKLKPLSELQSFIQENKHLPNIPSASQVEKEGISVGDMQKRMMEKIEELTLYVIELQQQVNALKNK